MKKTFEEFKNFAMKGNVIDLAIGLVIATAFQKIIESLVIHIIMPLLGVVTGGNNLSGLNYSFNSATIQYGMFLQAILDFTIVAFALFLAIKTMSRLKKAEETKPVETPKQEILLTEIRDLLKK